MDEDKKTVVIFVEKLEISKSTFSLFYVSVDRIRKVFGISRSSKGTETSIKCIDSKGIVLIETEITIPVTLSRKSAINGKQKLIRIQVMGVKDGAKERVAKFVFDVYSMENDTYNIKSMPFRKEKLTGTLYFRFRVIPLSSFVNESHSYPKINNRIENISISNDYSSQIPVLSEVLTHGNDETVEKPNHGESILETLTKPKEERVLNSPRTKSCVSIPKKQVKPTAIAIQNQVHASHDSFIRHELKEAQKIQKKLLSSIVIDQFAIKLNLKLCKSVLFTKIKNRDLSEEILDLINQYGFFSAPGLTTEKVLKAFEPLFLSIDTFFYKESSLVMQFSLLSGLIKLGQGISYIAECFTNAHLPMLPKFEFYISKLLALLASALSAPITSTLDFDGFGFSSIQQLPFMTDEIHKFYNTSKAFYIDSTIVDSIVSHACQIVDSTAFNYLISFSPEFNVENVSQLLYHVKRLQSLLQCSSEVFNSSFFHILELISIAKAIFIKNQSIYKNKDGDLLKTIISKCNPKPLIPSFFETNKIPDLKKVLVDFTCTSIPFSFQEIRKKHIEKHEHIMV